jgi:hypothetical protein
MDSETLTTLLRGEHINMPDRVARGVWPHAPLNFSEVLDHLSKLLEQNKWFPKAWHPHREGNSVDERATIERLDTGQFVYRAARAHAIQPQALTQTTEQSFPNARDAARHFLRWELRLPGDLDGWKVVE